MSTRNADAGLLEVEGEAITFRRGTHRWTVPMPAIVVVGEVTNQSGPGGDDWFLCLVTDADGTWREAPTGASGMKETLDQLSARLGAPIRLGLASSTDFESRVIWPPALAGRPLFVFTHPEPTTWWQRALRVVRLWPWHNIQRVHPDLFRELRSRTG